MNGPSTWTPSAPGTARCAFARRRQRRGEHRGRVGDDGRQEAGDALAAKGAGDARHALDGRLGVEQDAAAAVDLPVDEPWRENAAAEIDRLAAARDAPRQSTSARIDAVLDDEGVIVEKPLAIEQARAVRTFSSRGFPPVAIRRRPPSGSRRRSRRAAGASAARDDPARDRAASASPTPPTSATRSAPSATARGASAPIASAAAEPRSRARRDRPRPHANTRGAKAP